MKKYILKYFWLLPKKFWLLEYSTYNKITYCTNKDIKNISNKHDIYKSIKEKKDNKNGLRYIVTQTTDSKILFKINYIGNNKWLIESDYSNLKELTTICSQIILYYHNIHAKDNIQSMCN